MIQKPDQKFAIENWLSWIQNKLDQWHFRFFWNHKSNFVHAILDLVFENPDSQLVWTTASGQIIYVQWRFVQLMKKTKSSKPLFILKFSTP